MGGNSSTLESYDIYHKESRGYSKIPNNYNSLDQVIDYGVHKLWKCNNVGGELDEKAKIIHEDLTNHACRLMTIRKE